MNTLRSTIRRILFFIAAFSVCTLFSTPVRSQSTNGRIAFASLRDGDFEIYVMEPEGQRQRRLTMSEGYDARPSFSDDGTKIAFESDRDGNLEIYVMNADGTEQRRLTKSASNEYWPTWSPDGKRLAFVSYRDGNAEIYTMNADGSNQKRLTTNPEADDFPDWSPDGTKILYSSVRNGNRDVYAASIDGSSEIRLTTNVGDDGAPRWSIDGKNITWHSNNKIWVMKADGTNKVQLSTFFDDDLYPCWCDATSIAFTRNTNGNYEVMKMRTDGSSLSNLSQSSNWDQLPDWTSVNPRSVSGSGPRLVFSSWRDGNQEIYSMFANGSGQTRLTVNNWADNEPAISPDGKSIAFMTDRDGNFEIYKMDSDGKNSARLTTSIGADGHPRWSPDGTRICWSGEAVASSDEIFIMNNDGTGKSRLTNNVFRDIFPEWSRDGKQIYFSSDRSGDHEIYVITLTSGSLLRLTHNNGSDFWPSISIDGKRLAFASNRDGQWEIYTINPDGTGLQRVTNDVADDFAPSWSDDNRLYFHSNRFGSGSVFSTSPSESNLVNVTQSRGGDYVPSASLGDPFPTITSVTYNPSTQASGWFRSDVTVNLVATDVGYGVREVHYFVDMGIEHVVSGDRADFTVSGDGTHNIAYWSVDNADNWEAPQFATVRIDTTKPVTTHRYENGLLSLTATDAHSGVESIFYKVDGGPEQLYGSPVVVPFGHHTIDYRAKDIAGNFEESKNFTSLVGLSRISISPSTVRGGEMTTGQVELDSPAPSGGAFVSLSSNSGAVYLPSSVYVVGGQTSAAFAVFTGAVTTDSTSVVTAALNGKSGDCILQVTRAKLLSVVLSPSTVVGGSSTDVSVNISGIAPVGGVLVALSSNDSGVTLPASVVINEGKSTGLFKATTSPVTGTRLVTITATLNGESRSNVLSVLQPRIKAVSLSPSTVIGGTGSQLTVTLDAPAPVGGWLINLASSDVSATLSNTVTIAAGQTAVTVPVATKSVLTRTAVTLTATDKSGTDTITLVVEPVVGLQLRLSASSIVGGNTVNLTVELAETAPKSGATVALSGDNATLVLPVSIKVVAGSKTATVAVKSLAVVSDTTVRIAGTVNGFTDRAQILVTAPRPQAITFTPTAVFGGKPSTGTLTITGIAPVGGLTVQLSSDNAVATVAATVLVPAGKNVATFVVTTKAVASRTPVNISASTNGTTVSQQLAVQALTVQSVVLKPSTVVGGTPSVGTVTLNGVAPSGGLQVDITSNVVGVTVPAKVFVPAGKNIVTFTATTEPVGSNLEVTLTARANGDQVTSTLLVIPVLVSTVTVAPTTVVGGTSATGTVKLTVAPGIDTVVTLSSANPTIAAVPASVIVKKGSLSATFTVTTKKPAAQTVVILSGVTGGAAKIGKLTIKP